MRALALVLPVLLLAACGDPTVVTPVPTPTVTPVFASDEEALAAAEEAYARYLAVSDQIFAEGGANPERLEAVAVGDQLRVELEGFREASASGLRGEGQTSASDFVLQQFDRASDEGAVTVYLCEDVSLTDVIDSTGTSVVSSERPNLTTYEVVFDYSRDAGALLVADKHAWAEGC